MYLAKMEIIKDKLNEVTTQRAKLTAFDKEGKPFMQTDLENLEKGYTVVASFNHHGDTYFLITEK
jgi:hypothetical protein